jgi:2-oxoglutarate ferredoxin oxidoreductase subunit alpha
LSAFQEKYGQLWGRYKDVDGDGIPYRTIPGTNHPMAGYLTRGTGHTEMATYTEKGEDWVKNMERLHRKFEGARDYLPQPIVTGEGASVGIISFGSNDPAILEARDRLVESGVQTDYMRVRALPLAKSVHEFIEKHDAVFVVENNFDGQLAMIIRSESHKDTTHMHSLALGDSLPMTPKFVVDGILARIG